MPNVEKRNAIAWWILFVLAVAGVVTPFFFTLFGAETGDWVFGVIAFCIVFGIAAIVVAIMYTKRAGQVSRMLNNENLLAHWTYSTEEWAQFTQKEHKENTRDKRNMFVLVAVIAVIVGITLSFINPDRWLIYLFTVLGIILLIGAAAFWTVQMRYRQNRKYPGEVYISPDAAFINREFHSWHGSGASLEEVSYLNTDPAPPVIHVVYRVPSQYRRQSVDVRIPVPRGEEKTAEIIVARLQSQLKSR